MYQNYLAVTILLIAGQYPAFSKISRHFPGSFANVRDLEYNYSKEGRRCQ